MGDPARSIRYLEIVEKAGRRVVQRILDPSTDANLEMLIDWIRAYQTRTDACSLAAHRALFETYAGEKIELTAREAPAPNPANQ